MSTSFWFHRMSQFVFPRLLAHHHHHLSKTRLFNNVKRHCVDSSRSISQCTKYVVSSSYEDKTIPNVNLAHYVMKDWSIYGEKSAVTCSVTGRGYTYAQLQDSVHRLAGNLSRLGIKEGDVIFLLSHNLPEYCVIYLAVISLGAIITTNNPMYTGTEVSFALKLSGSKLVFAEPQLLPTVEEAVKLLGKDSAVQETIVIGDAPGYRPLSSMLAGDFADTSAQSSRTDWFNHIACLPFSSGTTGLPKGVMLSHGNIVSNLVQNDCGSIDIQRDDILAGILPLFHIYGQVGTMLMGLTNGSSALLIPKFNFEEFLRLCQDHKITYSHLVPPIILGMTKSDLTDKYDLSSLRRITSGAAPLKASTSLHFQEKFKNTMVIQGYGLTETSPVVTMNKPGSLNKHGSVGILLPNVKAKVVNLETDESLPANEEGELYFHGPNIMMGYWQNKGATEDCLDGQWFRSGDIGYYDEGGHFYVVDRLKELIKYKGFQVAPAELEALLIAHPDILDAAVIGVPCEEAGELPRAYVVPHAKSDITDQALHDYVSEKASNHKQLRGGIHRVSEIPKTASGKILRRVLKDQVLKEN